MLSNPIPGRTMRICLLACLLTTSLIGSRANSTETSDGSKHLLLKDGSRLRGQLVVSPFAGSIGLKSQDFDRPLFFDIDSIRSLSSNPTKITAAKGNAFILSNGSSIIGELLQWNESEVVIKSRSLGKVSLDPSVLVTFEGGANQKQQLYIGPKAKETWTFIGDADDWDFRAGSLTTSAANSKAVTDANLPRQFKLSLTMAWGDKANFVLSLGSEDQKNRADEMQRLKDLQNQIDELNEKIKQRAQAEGRRQLAQLAEQRQQLMARRQRFVVQNGRAVPVEDKSSAAVRLETWDGQLAIVREAGDAADIALLPLDDGAKRFDLDFYVDQVGGVVGVYSNRGKLLEKIQASDGKGKVRSHLMLENHGDLVSLDRLEVFQWDGRLPNSNDFPDSYAMDNDGKVIPGTIRSFDPNSGMLAVIDDDGKESRIALDELDRAVLAAPPDELPELDSNLARFELSDRSLIVGRLDSSSVTDSRSDGQFSFRADGVEEKLTCRSDDVMTIVGSKAAYAPDESAELSGVLTTESSSIHGALAEDEDKQDDVVLLWKPLASLNASPVAESSSGEIKYRNDSQKIVATAVKTRQASELGRLPELLADALAERLLRSQDHKVVGTRKDVEPQQTARFGSEITFSSGDTVRGEIKSVSEKGIWFDSPQTETDFASHAQIDSVTLNKATPSLQFDEQKMKRLLTVPRAQKNDPPTHLFMSVHGDYLRGRLLNVDPEYVELEVRLEIKRIETSKIARIIWLHERPWLDEKSPDESPDAQAATAKSVNNTANDVFLVHAIRSTGHGVTFEPKSLQNGELSGTSELLGKCSVQLSEIDTLMFGKDVGSRALKLREESWALELATLPRVYQESAAGDDPNALGLASPLIGRSAPDIRLDTIDGDRFDLDDHRGRVVVLDFWASWCAPCIQTMPEVERIVRGFSSHDVSLIAVNLQDSVPRAELAIDRMKLESATIVMDVDGETGRYYDANAIPQTVIIDREGNITHLFVGGGPGFLKQFALALQSVVEDSRE